MSDGHEHDLGLGHDLRTLVTRRRALGLFGGISAAALLAAFRMDEAAATSPAAPSPDPVRIPEETAGPFPGDGSNGVNVLDDSGIVRRDIRSSFGSSTTRAAGVPLTLRLAVRDVSTGDALAGAAVYVWQCSREGLYSLYSEGAENENYLRGVQVVDDDGNVSFTTIYPGCYPGRWPHIHFEVYSSVRDAIASRAIVSTSQVALPRESSRSAYTRAGYGASRRHFAGMRLANDMVFREDRGIHQLATMSGNATNGYTAALTVGVDANR